MKVKYIKNAITSLVLVVAMALPATAMAAETPAAANDPSTAPVVSITQAEKQELDDTCRKLEALEAQLDKLIEENNFGSELDSVEDQMAALRIRLVELTAKENPGEGEAADSVSIMDYVKELKLSEADKKALADAYAKLDELEKAADRGENVDSQMAAVEAQIAELEEKAFPVAADEAFSYEDYVKDLDLTDAEKQELVAAYKSQDSAKIAALELKAAVNEMTALTGGESQEYIDAVNQLKTLGDEMIRLILSGGTDEQLDQLAQKMEPVCDRMMELSTKQ